MKTYYVAGLPYSDELWHYGVKGQKWGIRQYQYEDGTLTPLGKIHYSAKGALTVAGRAGKVVGKAAIKVGKRIGKHELDKFKKRHPWVMSDEELKRLTDRVNKEKSYVQACSDIRRMNRGPVRKFLGDSIQTIANKIINRSGDELVKKIFDKPDPITDWEEILRNPRNYTDKEVGDAFTRSTRLKGLKENSKQIRSSSYGSAKSVEDVISNKNVGKASWATHKNKQTKTIFNDLGSSYGSSNSSSWTRNNGSGLNPDYVYNSWPDYRKAKGGKIKGW